MGRSRAAVSVSRGFRVSRFAGPEFAEAYKKDPEAMEKSDPLSAYYFAHDEHNENGTG